MTKEKLHEEFKSVAYTAKKEQELKRQHSQKILRILRDHERRIVALETELLLQRQKK